MHAQWSKKKALVTQQHSREHFPSLHMVTFVFKEIFGLYFELWSSQVYSYTIAS